MRYVATLGLFAILVPAMPAFAITPQQKMETCKFGADNQKLAGKARKTFIARCMANEDAPDQRDKSEPAK
jgi:hypothetical protein